MKNYWHFIIVIILVVSLHLNIGSSRFIGADHAPYFFSGIEVLNYLYLWTDNSLLGGISAQISYIYILAYKLFYLLNTLLGSKGLFFNSLILILSYLGFYQFIKYYFKGLDEYIYLSVSSVYIFSFFFHYLFQRNLLFMQMNLAISFFVIILMLKYIQYGIKYYLGISLFIGLFYGITSQNPGYFLPVMFLYLIIGWSYKIKFGLHTFMFIKRFTFFNFFLLFGIGISFISLLLFAKYNTSITSDSRNIQTLIKQPLELQKTTSQLTQTFRGYNGDLRAQRGFNANIKNRESYHPFPGYNLYQTLPRQIISRLPLLLMIIGLFFITGKDKRLYIFRFLVFLINLFFYKSSAEPFGFVFERLINNIGLFGIFRSPHQKLGFIFIVSQLMCLTILLGSIKSKKIQNLTMGSLLIYTVMMGYFWFTGNAIPSINLVKEIPSSYKTSATYINNNQNIRRIALLPYNESTRTNTNFGYEGYSLFSYLLPKKQMRNRNDIAFSSYNKIYMDRIGPILQNLSGDLIDEMNKLHIDTILYDGYTDRYPRFRHKENHTGTVSFIKQKGLVLDNKFGDISIWKNPYQKNAMIIGGDHIYTKLNPTKYHLSLTIPSTSTGEELRFLQSFHKEWKLYPATTPYICSGETQIYTGSSTDENLTPIIYRALSGDTRNRIANKNSIELSLLQSYNTGVKANFPRGQQFIVGYDEPLPTALTTTTECIQSGYTFFQGEELSYLWKKPLREESHQLVNEYANGWEIDLSKENPSALSGTSLGQGRTNKEQQGTQTYLQKGLREGRISKNPDGSRQVNLVLYFRPQSRFYLGLMISGITLLSLLGWLGWSWVRERKSLEKMM